MMMIDITCPIYGRTYSVEVPVVGFCHWKFEGMLIQKAMPDINPVVREALISGICPECWDETFSEETEENLDFGFDPFLGEYTWDC